MTEKSERQLKKKNLFKQTILETIAVAFWAYSIAKLFIFDIDLFLIKKYLPNLTWILEFKFLFIIGGLAIFWLFTKNRVVLTTVLYVLFYPVIILVWKIPKLIVKRKSWIGAFTFIGMVLSFFRSLKLNTIALALLLIPIAIVWRCENQMLLWTAAGLLCVFIFFLFSRAIYFSFKPSLLFKLQSKVVSEFWDTFKGQCSPDEDIKDLAIAQMNKKQLQQWSNSLQNAVIVNRMCYFLTTKLRDFQNSKINVFFYVTNFFFLVILTIISFAVLNLAIYKADPTSFSANFTPRFFHFVYYSTNTLFTNGIPDFYPVSTLARGIGTAEILFAFVLLVILFFLFTTVQSDRHNEDIEFSIRSMRAQGEHLDSFIKENYRLTVDEAIQELEKIKAAFIKAIFYLSSNIDMRY